MFCKQNSFVNWELPNNTRFTLTLIVINRNMSNNCLGAFVLGIGKEGCSSQNIPVNVCVSKMDHSFRCRHFLKNKQLGRRS